MMMVMMKEKGSFEYCFDDSVTLLEMKSVIFFCWGPE